MLSSYHIRLIIEKCRELGSIGLDNGRCAVIPQLQVDFVSPPNDFLGKGNPAVFVNKFTYKLLGKLHSDWIINQTIAIKTNWLTQKNIDVIGSIIHETGHAFNVAAKIDNSEANAYIFEIEVLCKLFEMNSPLLFGSTFEDLHSYFKRRLGCYKSGTHNNSYLSELVQTIKQQYRLDETIAPEPVNSEKISIFVAKVTLFEQQNWKREKTIITAKMAISF